MKNHQKQTGWGKIETGSAVSLSLAAILRSSEKSQDKKIETHITLSQKNGTLRETETNMTGRIIIETPMLRKPYQVEIEANSLLKKPTKLRRKRRVIADQIRPGRPTRQRNANRNRELLAIRVR